MYNGAAFWDIAGFHKYIAGEMPCKRTLIFGVALFA
jgi:hypothetical protein